MEESQAIRSTRAEIAVPPIRILVVDDIAANRRAFEAILSPLGCEVLLAASGEEALTLASRRSFALILLDMRMPTMSGLETAICLRRKPSCAMVPIVFISAHENTAVEVGRAKITGPIDYILSPVDGDVLTSRVKSYIEMYLKNELILRKAARLAHATETLRHIVRDPLPDIPELVRHVEGLSGMMQGLHAAITDRLGRPSDD